MSPERLTQLIGWTKNGRDLDHPWAPSIPEMRELILLARPWICPSCEALGNQTHWTEYECSKHCQPLVQR